MNIWSISIQNIKSKPLYTFFSVFILSISIALLLGIEQLKSSFKNQIDDNLGKIDLVIGAKGSPLQLVLASVLHLDNPTGNISYNEAKKIEKNPMIKTAVPISYGDNYKGFRIVGTTHAYYGIYNATLEAGDFAKHTMDVVLGATVAKKMNLKLGDKLVSSHGLLENSIDVHSDKLTVVGILKPTQKVIDRLIVTNLESVWDVHNHDAEHENHKKHDHPDDDDENHLEGKEITSLLVTFKNPRGLLTLPRKINKGTNMQAALPKYELNKLYEYTSVGFHTISWIAYLILVMSCLTIFINMYKMVKERAFDLAILRTYGASNLQLIKMMIYEGGIIGSLACLVGFLCVKIGLRFAVKSMPNDYQEHILQELALGHVFQIGMLIFLMVISSVLLAIYPMIKMNISTILSHEK
jgi:putative ABC transport system permease protein